jgi:hypothetical protein
MTRVNPRYVAYARAHGMTPARMAREDRKRWPGGCGTGFVIWCHERWAEWRKENGRPPHDALTDADYAAFDAWLDGTLGLAA